jgi:hypothetical protein
VTRYPNKVYKLLGADGRTVESLDPGQLGGHSGLKIYGRLDCWSANAHVRKGTYAASRVFFKDKAPASRKPSASHRRPAPWLAATRAAPRPCSAAKP